MLEELQSLGCGSFLFAHFKSKFLVNFVPIWNITNYINGMKVAFFAPLIAISAFCVASCGGSDSRPDKPLARVGDAYLNMSDLEDFGKGLSAEDSAYQVKIYIDKWIQDQIMYGIAAKNVSETPRMRRLVEDYRASLLLAAYEEDLIKAELDTFVSNQQIAEYYEQNQEQYQLGEDWVRCHFVRVRRDVQGAEQLREWFKSDSKANFDNIAKFCTANKTTHVLEENVWIKLSKVTAKLPEDAFSDRYLDGAILDKTDDEFIYLLRVFEYRDRSEPAPLQEVQHDIKNIILYQRRQTILQGIRQKAFENAKTNSNFEIY